PIKKLITRSGGFQTAAVDLADEKAPFLEVLQPAKIKDQQAIEEIRVLKPDVIVVVAYGQILPRDVLEIPRLACLNVHASLLPRCAVAAPIQPPIAAGDRETAITVRNLDEGPTKAGILLHAKVE